MSNYAATYIPIGQSTNAKLNSIVDELLTPRLLLFRQIEVNDEPLKLKTDRITWKTLWGNILPDAPIVINRAGERLTPEQFEVENVFGEINFTDLNYLNCIEKGDVQVPMAGPDGRQLIDVTANYFFDYFPHDVLESYILGALGTVNTAVAEAAPTYYKLDDFPDYWNSVLADLAFSMCMERLLLDYDLWKGRLIFAIGADQTLEGNGGDIIGQLTTLKQNAENRAYKTLDNPKFKAGYYVSLPTVYYWRAVYSPGMSGSSQMYNSGRLRGWKPNRLGR